MKKVLFVIGFLMVATATATQEEMTVEVVETLNVENLDQTLMEEKPKLMSKLKGLANPRGCYWGGKTIDPPYCFPWPDCQCSPWPSCYCVICPQDCYCQPWPDCEEWAIRPEVTEATNAAHGLNQQATEETE